MCINNDVKVVSNMVTLPLPYRLRRTQSGGLQAADPDAGQFRRGGLRATAGPRLTRTPESYDSAR